MKAAALALLLLGCKAKPDDSENIAKLVDEVCACKDLACADRVARAFQQDSAKTRTQSTPELDRAIKKMGACYARLAAVAAQAGSGSARASSLPAVPAKRDADAAIAAARTWQQATQPRLTVWQIRASYVEANGAIDGENGFLTVQYGASNTPVDDPGRKTGAPVKPDTSRPESCPVLRLTTSWSHYDGACREVPDYTPKCTVAQIWKRAIEQGAPADALAVILFDNDATPSWRFDITDEPRRVNIQHTFDDDCELAVERSP